MKTTNESLRVVNHEDAEHAGQILQRAAALKSGEELDPSKLMELLGDIDGLKREIHERMRRIDAVKEAKTFLIEEAARAETLNQRMAEMSTLVNAVQSGPIPVRNAMESTSPRAFSDRTPGEGRPIAWPKPEDSQESASRPLEGAGQTRSLGNVAGIAQDAIPKSVPTSSASGPLPPSNARESAASDRSNWGGQVVFDTRELHEARNLLAKAQATYQEASDKQGEIATELQAAQKHWKLAYESASQRLEEAARSQAEAAEARAISEATLAKAELALVEACEREQAATSDMQSSRQELTTAYQFAAVAAQRRLEAADFFERAARWSVFAAVPSWVATVWMAWIAMIAFHMTAPLSIPILVTIILLLGGIVLVRRKASPSNED